MKLFADDKVSWESPRWACVVAPGCKYYFHRRPCWWFRLWQRLLLGWRWSPRQS